MAVRLLLVLLEGALIELLQAEGAVKVLRVVLLEHGGNAATGNGLAAAGAQGASMVVVVILAEGLPLNVKVRCTVKG